MSEKPIKMESVPEAQKTKKSKKENTYTQIKVSRLYSIYRIYIFVELHDIIRHLIGKYLFCKFHIS